MADLSGVKQGDLIAVRTYKKYFSGPTVAYDIYKVDRVTNTQVVCGARKFRKSDGRLVGKSFTEAVPATSEIVSVRNKQVAARTKYDAVRNLIENIDRAARNNNLSESEQDQLLAVFKDKNWS